MNTFLIVLLIGFVLMMLIFNVYFRYRILGDYKYLVKNKIEFGSSHIFNQAKLEKEVIPRYPKHEDQIRSFCQKIRKSFVIAIALLVLTFFFAFILKSIQF